MECLRCGYCCINYDVIIVDNPELGIVDDNLIWKKCKELCKHLRGNEIKGFSCLVHEYEWYVDTPCFAYTQIAKSSDAPCRTGLYNYNKDFTNRNIHLTDEQPLKIVPID